MTGSATRVAENITRQQRPWAFSTQRVVVLRVGLVRVRHRDRLPSPESVAMTGPALSADADPAAVAAAGPDTPGTPACRHVRRSSRLRFRLAALRWRVAFVVVVGSRPPPGVSTACFVTGTHFSVTRLPRVPPLRMCPRMLEEEAAHSQGPHARRDAPPRSPDRACGSRAPLKELRPAFARQATGGCPAPVPRGP
jgi:hypothetical protein